MSKTRNTRKKTQSKHIGIGYNLRTLNELHQKEVMKREIIEGKMYFCCVVLRHNSYHLNSWFNKKILDNMKEKEKDNSQKRCSDSLLMQIKAQNNIIYRKDEQIGKIVIM